MKCCIQLKNRFVCRHCLAFTLVVPRSFRPIAEEIDGFTSWLDESLVPKRAKSQDTMTTTLTWNEMYFKLRLKQQQTPLSVQNAVCASWNAWALAHKLVGWAAQMQNTQFVYSQNRKACAVCWKHWLFKMLCVRRSCVFLFGI